MNGKYGLVTLNSRYQDIQLPEIQIVDIKDLQKRKMMQGPFSPLLLGSIKKALAAGEQVILFQNRRGFASMIECRQCGWVPHCTNCDVSLTFHKNIQQLTCHYCGYTYQVPTVCPCCGSTELKGRGYGTEKIEDQVMEIFPEARVARIELDTTRTRSAYERIISDFSAGRTNLLIGTQMVSKGLDFDKVSVVGILKNADCEQNGINLDLLIEETHEEDEENQRILNEINNLKSNIFNNKKNVKEMIKIIDNNNEKEIYNMCKNTDFNFSEKEKNIKSITASRDSVEKKIDDLKLNI